MSDTREKLSGATIGLHWIIAIGMIGMVAFGLYIDDLPRGESKSALVQIHKSIGVVILVLATWRLWRRVRIGMPPHVGMLTVLEETTAKITHAFLLFATLAMPLSGIALSIGSARPINIFGLPFIPQILATKNEALASAAGGTHAILGKVIIAAIVLHIIGALKHSLADKDGTMKRMLGQRVTPAQKA